MIKRSSHLILLTWLALAINLLLPLSHTIMPLSGGSFLTICTAQGIETIALNKDGSPVNIPTDKTKKKCAFCLAQTAQAITPETAFITKPLTLAINNIIWHEAQALLPEKRRKTNQSRAPPKTS